MFGAHAMNASKRTELADVEDDGEMVTEDDLEPDVDTVVVDVEPLSHPGAYRNSYFAARRRPSAQPREDVGRDSARAASARPPPMPMPRPLPPPPELRRTPVPAADGAEVGAVMCGKYRIESVVSRDGQRTTARVRHLELGEVMLLTCVSPAALSRPEVIGGFLRSARGALQIHNEHVSRITDVGRLPNGAPYMVSEHLDGMSLDDVLRVRGVVPLTEAVDYVVQALHAVAEAHTHGIVHGALSPSWLELVRRADGSPLIKVSGFGAAASTEELLVSDANGSNRRALRDVLPYVAPERLRQADPLDARTDVYSIGAILYELVTGRPAFYAATPAALLATIAADVIVPPSALRADLSHEVDAVVARCMEKTPSARFASVSDLALALRPLAAPDTRELVDRVVRILARSSAAPSPGPLVLVGSNGPRSSPDPHVAPSGAPPSRAHLFPLAALGAGIGAGAMVAGAALVLALQGGLAGAGSQASLAPPGHSSSTAGALPVSTSPALAVAVPVPAAGSAAAAPSAEPAAAATGKAAPPSGTAGDPTEPSSVESPVLSQRWWSEYRQAQAEARALPQEPANPRGATPVTPPPIHASRERSRRSVAAVAPAADDLFASQE